MPDVSALPSAISVGPFVYDVVLDKAKVDAHCRAMRRDMIGVCDHVNLTLSIDPSQASDQMADTVLHETLHAIVRMVGLNSGDEEWGYDREENVVSRLAPALLDLLRRNPDLVTFLTS